MKKNRSVGMMMVALTMMLAGSALASRVSSPRAGGSPSSTVVELPNFLARGSLL